MLMEFADVKKWVIFFLGILCAIIIANALSNLIMEYTAITGWVNFVVELRPVRRVLLFHSLSPGKTAGHRVFRVRTHLGVPPPFFLALPMITLSFTGRLISRCRGRKKSRHDQYYLKLTRAGNCVYPAIVSCAFRLQDVREGAVHPDTGIRNY